MATTETPTAPLTGAPEEETAEERSRGRRIRERVERVAWIVVVMLVGVAIGYVVGRAQGAVDVGAARAELSHVRTEHSAALAAGEAEVERAEARAQEIATHARLLEGARQITRAQRALDARNFGTAESRLRDAEQALRGVSGEVEGASALASELASTRIVVAEDLAEQRDALTSLAERADALIERSAPALPPPTDEGRGR